MMFEVDAAKLGMVHAEDFLFGFALVTAVLLLWERQRLRDRKSEDAS